MPRPPKARRPATSARPISERLEAALRSSGLSAYEVGDRAGLNRNIIARFLQGRRGLSLDSADAIASALGLRLVEPERRARPRRIAGEPFPNGNDSVVES